MFAVNGPSGPTSRNERRVKTDKQRAEEEETRRFWAEKKRGQFFQEKRALPGDIKNGKSCVYSEFVGTTATLTLTRRIYSSQPKTQRKTQ
jgi:hypothetical protein